jgi:hypothetical protein
MARERADAAVTATLTPLCPGVTGKLAELQKTASWSQSQFIEKGGWATLGSKTPNAAVARACAAQLTKTKI